MLCLFTAVAVVARVLATGGLFSRDVWERKSPLVNPISVTAVCDGIMRLDDGRELRPAGIRRRTSVSPRDFDKALRTMTAQGVIVLRDLGDGRAFLLAEPKFSNSCGTRKGLISVRWAGAFIPCRMSELLVRTGYAEVDPDLVGLDARERWRLEGVGYFGEPNSEPTYIVDSLNALRYEGFERSFNDYDATLELFFEYSAAPRE